MDQLLNRISGQTLCALMGNQSINHKSSVCGEYVDGACETESGYLSGNRPSLMRLDSTGEVVTSQNITQQTFPTFGPPSHENRLNMDNCMLCAPGQNRFSIKNILPHLSTFNSLMPCLSKGCSTMSLGSQGMKYLPQNCMDSTTPVTMSKLNPYAEPWYPPTRMADRDPDPIEDPIIPACSRVEKVSEEETAANESEDLHHHTNLNCSQLDMEDTYEVHTNDVPLQASSCSQVNSVTDDLNSASEAHTNLSPCEEDNSSDIAPLNCEIDVPLQASSCSRVNSVVGDLNFAIKDLPCGEEIPEQAMLSTTPQVFNIHISTPAQNQQANCASSITAEVRITPKMNCTNDKKKKGRLSAKRRHKQKERRQPTFGKQFPDNSAGIDISHNNSTESSSSNRKVPYANQSSPVQTFLVNMTPPLGSSGCQESPPTKFALSFILQSSDESASEEDDDSGWDDSDTSDEIDGEMSWDALPSGLQNPLCGSFNFHITISDIDTNKTADSCVAKTLDLSEEQNELDSRVKAVNASWDSMYCDIDPGVPRKHKVTFPLHESALVDMIPLDPRTEVEAAYAAARKGQWEEYARDHERFQLRIREVEKIISPCLLPAHRDAFVKRLHASL